MLLSMMTVTAFAEDYLYAVKDNVKIYKKKDTDSKVKKKLSGGERVMLVELSSNQKWAEVAFVESDGLDYGYVQMKNMSYTMPSNVCSHEWSNWYVVSEPTCTNSGTRARSCSICGVGESQDIPALGHSWGSWVITAQPTCTSEGQRVSTCQVCGQQQTETLNRLPHTYNDWTVTAEPTCTAEGERNHRCVVCGYEEKQTLEKLPHSYGEWTVVKEATCTAEGLRTHTCQVCGCQSEEAISVLPHDFEWQILVEATDHSAGIRTNVCRDCGYTEEEVNYDPEGTLRRGDKGDAVHEVQQLLADQQYLNDSGVDGTFGGGTEKAIMEFQDDQGLTPDGVAWPQTINRLRHEFGQWEITKTLTREEAGERTRTCKDCGYEQVEILTLEPYFEYGRRGEDVRAVQQMLTTIGCDAGSYDGIYGAKLDAAITEFAKANDFTFEAGKVLPAHIDALVNSWVETISDENWKGESGLNTPVNLALTVTPVQEQDENNTDEITTFSWTLTNMGTEPCVFTALLLNFGSDPEFREENLTMVLDGVEMLPGCQNSVSGSFRVNKNWGEGDLGFAALGVSEVSGAAWLSNVEEFTNETSKAAEAVEEPETNEGIETEDMEETTDAA